MQFFLKLKYYFSNVIIRYLFRDSSVGFSFSILLGMLIFYCNYKNATIGIKFFFFFTKLCDLLYIEILSTKLQMLKYALSICVGHI